MTIVPINPIAVRVLPLKDGLAPLLKPREFCRTLGAEGELWHFCAPDGSRFALLAGDVTVSRAGLVTIRSPAWASFHAGKEGVMPCAWTMTAGRWGQI
jgi:hypothetical protein